MTIKLEEILCVRNTRVRLYGEYDSMSRLLFKATYARLPERLAGGAPKENVADDEPNADRPNVLYLYYAHKRNVFIWRAREAELIFLSTADKKKWESTLHTAVAGQLMRSVYSRPLACI